MEGGGGAGPVKEQRRGRRAQGSIPAGTSPVILYGQFASYKYKSSKLLFTALPIKTQWLGYWCADATTHYTYQHYLMVSLQS